MIAVSLMKLNIFIFINHFHFTAPKTCSKKNEEYSDCGNPCHKTCANPNERVCSKPCQAGCFCREGYFRDEISGECVKNLLSCVRN